MNNIPENMKEFNLELAQQGHPICTRQGREVKFIAYIKDVVEQHKLIVQIGDEVFRYPCDGVSTAKLNRWDLFLAPLGLCEGKPVFAGDVLVGKKDNFAYPGKEFVVNVEHDNFYAFEWPKPKCVVETRMEWGDFRTHYKKFSDNNNNTIGSQGIYWDSAACENLANKAIERAIADGDVIPTSVVEELIHDTILRDRDNMMTLNCYIIIKDVLKKYKEGLK